MSGRRSEVVTAILTFVLVLCAAQAAAATDDDIPGVPITASPIVSALDSASDIDDVYSVWLEVGDVISAQLGVSAATTGFNPRLFLYAPGTTSLTRGDEVALSLQPGFPKSFSYTATQAGDHFLDVWQEASALGDPVLSGTATVTWSVWRPVHRFYNYSLGTHFYTATDAERRRVVATLSNTYLSEGPAYGVNPYTNEEPLWRFYRPSTGTHFYTSDPEEMARVATTLSHVYIYEGPAYSVSRSPAASSRTIWRFYNLRNGTHFYTAEQSEMERVRSTLGHVYLYEGLAFYVTP